jgi:CRP/FNR family cyclic AMP-dependent transcriptional regulator
LLGRLRPPLAVELLRLGAMVRFLDGECLLREGEQSQHVFVVRRGWLKVIGTLGNDRETLLAIRGAGDLVGELAALDRCPRVATVRASGECLTQRIAGEQFLSFLAQHPEVERAVQATVVGKLRSATRRRVEFTAYPVKVRIARVLIELAEICGRTTAAGTRLPIPLTQTELAALVGVAEPTVHRILSELRQSGVVATGYRQLTIIDHAVLVTLAEPHSPGDGGAPTVRDMQPGLSSIPLAGLVSVDRDERRGDRGDIQLPDDVLVDERGHGEDEIHLR